MVAAAASPSPAPRAAAGSPHPTYTKMITHALTELGSASPRSAIAARILGRGYSGLPARHDELLSAHLRRLVAEGVLRLLVSHGGGADAPSSYMFAPQLAGEEKRGPGRPPRKDTPPVATPAAAPMVVGEKRGRGRPRKTPAGAASSSDKSPHAGIATHSLVPPAKRKRGLSPTESPGEDADSVTKRWPGRPEEAAAPIKAGAEEAAGGGQEAWALHNGGAVRSGGGVKRGRGRPRKEKPSVSVAAASRGFKKGCGRPSPLVSAASFGNGVLRKERLAAAPAGVKRSRGRPRKDQRIGGLVEGAYEVFFRDMTTEAGTRREEDDLVSGEKTPQTEEGVAPRDGKDTRAADAGCVPVSGEAAGASAPVGAVDSDHLGPADVADDVVSTAVKRGRGRPRKNKPAAAAMSAETGDAASAGIEPEGGTPRMEESSATRSPETTGDAASSTAVKRPRGRPRKNPAAAAAMSSKTRDLASTGGVKRGRGRPPKKKPAAPMSAETGDAASTGVKRGRGRPRKEKPAAAATGNAGVKRGRGRPMKVGSVGTWYAESAAERELFGHMAEEAPGDREEARVANDAGRVPVSGENAATAPAEAGNSSGLGPGSL